MALEPMSTYHLTTTTRAGLTPVPRMSASGRSAVGRTSSAALESASSLQGQLPISTTAMEVR